jgi:hypothetical protein
MHTPYDTTRSDHLDFRKAIKTDRDENVSYSASHKLEMKESASVIPVSKISSMSSVLHKMPECARDEAPTNIARSSEN